MYDAERQERAEARQMAIDVFAGRFPFPDTKRPIAMHFLISAYEKAKEIIKERPC